MIRLGLFGLALILSACAPMVDEAPAPITEAVVIEPAPLKRASPLDACAPTEDGIGGTGCKDE